MPSPRYGIFGNKLPYLFITIKAGDKAGRYDIPIRNSDVDYEEFNEETIKDQNKNAYAISNETTDATPAGFTLEFQALKPEYTELLIEFQKHKGTIELQQADEGRDGVHHDYFIVDPSIRGIVKLQGQGSFTLTFSGNVQSTPAL